MGLVSRATPVHMAIRNCTRDEGRSFEVGNQGVISRHRMSRLRAQVIPLESAFSVRCASHQRRREAYGKHWKRPMGNLPPADELIENAKGRHLEGGRGRRRIAGMAAMDRAGGRRSPQDRQMTIFLSTQCEQQAIEGRKSVIDWKHDDHASPLRLPFSFVATQ
jgi:hypothetical protein